GQAILIVLNVIDRIVIGRLAGIGTAGRAQPRLGDEQQAAGVVEQAGRFVRAFEGDRVLGQIGATQVAALGIDVDGVNIGVDTYALRSRQTFTHFRCSTGTRRD